MDFVTYAALFFTKAPRYPYQPTQTCCLCSAGALTHSAWRPLPTKIKENRAVFNASS